MNCGVTISVFTAISLWIYKKKKKYQSSYLLLRVSYRENLYSIKSDGPLTRELEEKHEHQDDEKGMKDRLLENIPEPEPVVGDLGLGHLGVQRHEGVEVILMEREQFLQICCIFKTDSENAHQEIMASSNFMLCMLQLTTYYFLFCSTDINIHCQNWIP